MSIISIGILTVSDTCSAGTATDTSGPHLMKLVKTTLNVNEKIHYEIVPDDLQKIEEVLVKYVDILKLDLVLTTGGTGFGPRDVTPEATKNIIHRETPQLTLAVSLFSLQKTKFAALSRSISGIRNESLIINFPGSKKAVSECFEAIADILPHAMQHLKNNVVQIREVHKDVQLNKFRDASVQARHVCPHKTNTGHGDDRNSPYPMLAVDKALEIIFKSITKLPLELENVSSIDLPPFRASLKDGYAMRSSGGSGTKTVVAYISAGDEISTIAISDSECFKINTGAPIPEYADCVIQVEDTKLTKIVDGKEIEVVILSPTTKDLDIRPIANDLKKGELLFTETNHYPGQVPYKSMLASVGRITEMIEPEIGIISTGDELVDPGMPLGPGKIYDSNMTMLKELLKQFGFSKIKSIIAKDDFQSLKSAMEYMISTCPITICTGGVSMGDKDFVKPVLTELGFTTHFGRVNMKPGKPMTFASNNKGQAVFGLPGNPVSSFVTFHLFVVPALKFITNYTSDKLSLPVISVELLHDSFELDPRPEYARATITSRDGKLYAEITGNQISSRLKSIIGADVLLHLPGYSAEQVYLKKGTVLKASVLRCDFISKYE